MKPPVLFGLLFFPLMIGCQTGIYKFELKTVQADQIMGYPEIFNEKPTIPSPCMTPEGREFLVLRSKDDKWTVLDVTVENGDPRNYKDGTYGKGAQLLADEKDFPTLAKTGLHSDRELRNTLTITGKSVSQITIDGRPWGSSGVGFMAEDETIMSVIWGDNRTVKKLGLTHPDIARPWFHLWNVGWEMGRIDKEGSSDVRFDVSEMVYHGKTVTFTTEGSRGWQESIFNDEILGTGHIRIERPLDPEDEQWLDEHYGHLSAVEMEEVKKWLSYEHTGELVLYCITRYGFYEGFNEYKVDPIKTAYIFGLRTIEEIHAAADGDLYKYFTTPHTENPEQP